MSCWPYHSLPTPPSSSSSSSIKLNFYPPSSSCSFFLSLRKNPRSIRSSLHISLMKREREKHQTPNSNLNTIHPQSFIPDSLPLDNSPFCFSSIQVMRKKMGLTSIFKIIVDPTRFSSSTSSSSSFSYPPDSPSSWAWPSCKHPRTLSFRIAAGGGHDQDVYKTVNSIYFDTTPSSPAEDEKVEEQYSVTDHQIIPLPAALEEEEEITKDDDGDDSEECIETVIHGLRSDRLFFEPGGDSSSILVESTTTEEPELPATREATALKALLMEEEEKVAMSFKESVAEEMESENPYVDFRVSMEAMVKAHGLNDWDCLEELLGWYLRMNGKKTHVFILGAFVDLLLDLANSFSPSSSPSFCSSTSSTSSSCFCTCSSPTTTTTSSSSVKFVSKDHQNDQEVKKENHNDADDQEEPNGSC